MRLILIDNDIDTGVQTEMALRRESYAVDRFNTVSSAELALRTEHYDLIMLDSALSDGAGLGLLQKYRSGGGNVPVFVVTDRLNLRDRVVVLDSGADDYLAKPFYTDELLARVRVLLRRRSGHSQPWVTHGGLRVNLSSHQVLLDDAPVHLTRREFAILRALLSPVGAVVSTAQLERKIYGTGDEVESNTVSVYIHNLRKKIGSGLIQNVRGAGFMIMPCRGRPM